MKKEFAALICLVLLFGATLTGTRFFSRTAEQAVIFIREAEELAVLESYETAADKAMQAESLWKKAAPFTAMLIRQSEADAAAELFFELQAALDDRNKADTMLAGKKLCAKLESMAAMERLTLKSIF